MTGGEKAVYHLFRAPLKEGRSVGFSEKRKSKAAIIDSPADDTGRRRKGRKRVSGGPKATSMSAGGGGRPSARCQWHQRKSTKPRLAAGKASLPHATRRPGSPVWSLS